MIELPDLSDGVVIKGGVAVWIGKMLFDMVVNKYKKHQAALDKNTEALTELKMAITELRVEVKWLREISADIPIVKRDLNSLGDKVRKMEARES